MAVPVRGNLVTGGGDGAEESGKPLRHPAEHEERAPHGMLIEDRQQPLGIAHDPALARLPGAPRHDAVERAHLEVVLDVDGHGVHDRPIDHDGGSCAH